MRRKHPNVGSSVVLPAGGAAHGVVHRLFNVVHMEMMLRFEQTALLLAS